MRRITHKQLHRDYAERRNDPTGGQLTLYTLVGDGYKEEFPVVLIIPSPDPRRKPFLVHRLRDEDAVRKLIDSLNDALREEEEPDPGD